jgi:hypothetical protein
MLAPCFTAFILTQSIRPFCIQKSQNLITGKVRNAAKLKNGTLLVKVCNEKQVLHLRDAKLQDTHLVHVWHISLASSPLIPCFSIKISTKTEDLSNPAGPGAKMQPYQNPVHSVHRNHRFSAFLAHTPEALLNKTDFQSPFQIRYSEKSFQDNKHS